MDYSGIEILFAEDSPDDALLSIRALRKCGLAEKLHHVRDGAQALDFIYCRGMYANRAVSEMPKLVLLDLKMPKISGIEVLQQIKSDERTKSLVVVILTSSREDPDIKRCYELGVNSYIVKPVDSENFFQSLKALGMYWMTINQTQE